MVHTGHTASLMVARGLSAVWARCCTSSSAAQSAAVSAVMLCDSWRSDQCLQRGGKNGTATKIDLLPN